MIIDTPRLEELYRGLREAEDFILKLKPDLLLVPLRGAKPLHVLVSRLAEADGRLGEMPPYLELPVGEVSSSKEGMRWVSIKADTPEKKKEMVRELLIPKLKSIGKPRPLVCVLDEAGSGGALVKNIGYVEEAMLESFPDGRVVAAAIGGEWDRSKEFRRLRARGVIHEITLRGRFGVPSLLTQDKPELLEALELDEQGRIRVRGGGEPWALTELSDAVLEFHRIHKIAVQCKSKVLETVGRWRGTSLDDMQPKRLRPFGPNLWVSGMPRTGEHIEAIKRLGIGSLVSLEPLSHVMRHNIEGEGIRVFNLFFRDESAPAREQINQFLDIMCGEEKSGRRVLVHCRHGLGRVQTLGLVYLIHKGVSLEDLPAAEFPASKIQRECILSFYREKQLRGKLDTSVEELEKQMKKALARKLQQKRNVT